MLEKTPERPLDSKEIKPINPKGNQSWIFIGRTDAETEAPTLWPPDTKNWFIGKDPDAGKDWRQEKGTTEDEMVGWHPWLNGHEFEEAWCAAVHGVTKSRAQLSDLTELTHVTDFLWFKFFNILLFSRMTLWQGRIYLAFFIPLAPTTVPLYGRHCQHVWTEKFLRYELITHSSIQLQNERHWLRGRLSCTQILTLMDLTL